MSAARVPNAVWVIVVGDDHSGAFDGRPMFQDTLRRAMRIAPVSQILVTARDADRSDWEPALWFIPPEHRFLSTRSGMSWLTTASAILAIAYQAPHSIVTLLPGRCFVSHEAILSAAIERAFPLLPQVPEGVISLGMQDLAEGIDEDYLVLPQGERTLLQPLLGVARRPLPWIARHLRAGGALVASRVTFGYARTLAAHIALVWPGLASRLLEPLLKDAPQRTEGGVRIGVPRDLPSALLRARHWYPPALPQRALRVQACGWSGLRTPSAVARVNAFLGPAQLTRGRAVCSEASSILMSVARS